MLLLLKVWGWQGNHLPPGVLLVRVSSFHVAEIHQHSSAIRQGPIGKMRNHAHRRESYRSSHQNKIAPNRHLLVPQHDKSFFSVPLWARPARQWLTATGQSLTWGTCRARSLSYLLAWSKLFCLVITLISPFPLSPPPSPLSHGSLPGLLGKRVKQWTIVNVIALLFSISPSLVWGSQTQFGRSIGRWISFPWHGSDSWSCG